MGTVLGVMRVRVVDDQGHTVFNRLHDDGGDTLRFPPGSGGWVDRPKLQPGQRVVPGWLTLDELNAERDQRWPGWR